MSTTDLTKATRELFVRSLVDEIHMKTPVVEELQRRKQVNYSGGKYIERLVDTAEMDDLMQEYTTNEALEDGKKTTLEKPRFTWRYAQLPLRYDVDEYLQNVTAGNEIQLLNLADHLVKKGQKATKLWLCAKMFNSASATPVTDGAKTFQSFVSALNHDTAYGTISRTISSNTNDWWQGADPANLTANISSSSQDTAVSLTVANIRKWVNETDVSHYMDTQSDLMILMCPTLWNKLASEMESKLLYKPGLKQKQGITSMYLDNHEIVSVPYLQKSATTWVIILNLEHWELRIHTKRNFALTPFKWQGDISNGHDYWLARIMISGNFMCWKPNGSLWLSNVS